MGETFEGETMSETRAQTSYRRTAWLMYALAILMLVVVLVIAG
jgi:hypothetical protein